MDLGLKGMKVILTGGSRGIGRAALEIFAAEGCDIGFFSRNAEQVAETVESLSKHGGKVIGETFDMDNFDDYPAWLTKTADALGGCDIFIPNVSASGAGPPTTGTNVCNMTSKVLPLAQGHSNHIWKIR